MITKSTLRKYSFFFCMQPPALSRRSNSCPKIFQNPSLKSYGMKSIFHLSAENGQHGGSIDQFKTRIQVSHNGLNTWYIPAILKSSCGTDITFFPFDIQVCEMKFGSWTYLSHEINLTNVRDTMDLAAYLNSSSFYLRKTEAIRNVVYYP